MENLELPELYSCWTRLEKFGEHTNFAISFFHGSGKRLGGVTIPYDKAIDKYHELDDYVKSYPEEAIDELFLLSEVKELEAYLAKYYSCKLEYAIEELPIANNIGGWTSLPFDRGRAYEAMDTPDRIYTLDFNVYYGYDTRFCKCPHCIEFEATKMERWEKRRKELEREADLLVVPIDPSNIDDDLDCPF
jgi:hypothetical protein